MTTIVTRAGKGSALTHNEVDTNFTNLNSAKYESGNNATLGTIQGSTITATTAFSGALNGTVGATTPAAGTFTSLSDSGNLTFTGTGNRITGDFTNATVASRVAFQTSTTNGATAITVLPNGTATTTVIDMYNAVDAANSGTLRAFCFSTSVGLAVSRNGTGTFLPLTFSTSNSERMRIDSAGNVGIGTNNPQVALEVLRTGNVSQIVAANGTITQRVGYCAFGAAFSGTATNHPYVLLTNDTERMRIDASGNVGIGTSSPANKLDVVGDSARNVARASTTAGQVLVEAQVSDYWSVPNYTGTSLRQSGSTATGTSAGLSNANLGSLIFQNCSAGLIATNGGSPIVLATTDTERMRIDNSGNVGIGTSTTTYRTNIVYSNTAGGIAETGLYLRNSSTGNSTQMQFDGHRNWSLMVQGSFGAPAGGFTIQDNTAGANRLSIDSSGNVGIGTSSPGQKLDVSGNGQFTVTSNGTSTPLTIANNGTSGTVVAKIAFANGGTVKASINAAVFNNDFLTFNTGSDTERMRIHASGGVSIGNTTDSGLASLNVSGSISGGYVALADGTTAMPFGADNVVRVTPTATATYTTTVPAAGAICVLSILTSGTTSRTITFGTGFKATGTLATGTVSARYFNITFVSDGTNLIEMSRTVAIA